MYIYFVRWALTAHLDIHRVTAILLALPLSSQALTHSPEYVVTTNEDDMTCILPGDVDGMNAELAASDDSPIDEDGSQAGLNGTTGWGGVVGVGVGERFSGWGLTGRLLFGTQSTLCNGNLVLRTASYTSLSITTKPTYWSSLKYFSSK
jgi:hypothetical protein